MSVAFESSLLRALLSDAPDALAGLDPQVAALVAQPGFAVHRNTCIGGCVEALRAAYPAVFAAVGADAFDAVALAFVRAQPPRTPVLAEYGEGFDAFLREWPPFADWPWLGELAWLERAWLESHLAADACAADPGMLASLAPEALGAMRLVPSPSARWRAFDDAPIVSIWRANRDPDPLPGLPPVDLAALDWRAEAALLVRTHDHPVPLPLPRGGTAFLDACADGETLGAAATRALAADPALDLASLLGALLRAGAFAAPAPLRRAGAIRRTDQEL